MLQEIRYHRMRGVLKHCFGCVGSTLLKPRVPPDPSLDIKTEHLELLRGKKPITFAEKRIHAILIHENTHSERQLQCGVWLHQLRYIFSCSFRWAEEQAAYGAEIAQMVRYQFRTSSTRLAKIMSGPAYRRMFRNMVDYDQARRWVRETITAAEVQYLAECMESDREEDRMGKDHREFDTSYEMLAPRRTVSFIKDRIALICCACLGFIIVFSILMALFLLSDVLSAKH